MRNYPSSNVVQFTAETQELLFQLLTKTTKLYRKYFMRILDQVESIDYENIVLDDIYDGLRNEGNIQGFDTELLLENFKKCIVKFNILNLKNIGSAEKTMAYLNRSLTDKHKEFYSTLFAIYASVLYIEDYVARYLFHTSVFPTTYKNFLGHAIAIAGINPIVERLLISDLFSGEIADPEHVKNILEQIYGITIDFFKVYLYKRDDQRYYYVPGEGFTMLATEQDKIYLPLFVPTDTYVETTFLVVGSYFIVDYNSFYTAICGVANSTAKHPVVLKYRTYLLTKLQIVAAFMLTFLIASQYLEFDGVLCYDLSDVNDDITDAEYTELVSQLIQALNCDKTCITFDNISSLLWKLIPKVMLQEIIESPVLYFAVLYSYIHMLNINLEARLLLKILDTWFASFILYPYKLLLSLIIQHTKLRPSNIKNTDFASITDDQFRDDTLKLTGNLKHMYQGKKFNFNQAYYSMVADDTPGMMAKLYHRFGFVLLR